MLTLLAALQISTAATTFGFPPALAARRQLSRSMADSAMAARTESVSGGAVAVQLPMALSLEAGTLRDRFVFSEGSVGVVAAAAAVTESMAIAGTPIEAQVSVAARADGAWMGSFSLSLGTR